MSPRKKQTASDATPLSQIQAYLANNQEDHYNFEEVRDYTISSGSLLLDIEMGGGIKPGVIRASGVTEGGKTSCALSFARNFQQMENSMVVYIKAEGRLSDDIIERAGIDTDENKFFVYKSNVYESVIDFMRDLVKNNPSDTRYMFIIDSMDALVPRGDLEKETRKLQTLQVAMRFSIIVIGFLSFSLDSIRTLFQQSQTVKANCLGISVK